MSTDRNIYLGPYLEYRVPVMAGPEDRCRRPRECPGASTGFCPKCGQDLDRPRMLTWVDQVDLDTFDMFDDVLVDGPAETLGRPDRDGVRGYAVRTLVSNGLREPPRAYWFDIGDEPVHPDTEMIDRDLTWFSKAHYSEIKAILAVDGLAGVLVRWGFLTWFS